MLPTQKYLHQKIKQINVKCESTLCMCHIIYSVTCKIIVEYLIQFEFISKPFIWNFVANEEIKSQTGQ